MEAQHQTMIVSLIQIPQTKTQMMTQKMFSRFFIGTVKNEWDIGSSPKLKTLAAWCIQHDFCLMWKSPQSIFIKHKLIEFFVMSFHFISRGYGSNSLLSAWIIERRKKALRESFLLPRHRNHIIWLQVEYHHFKSSMVL
jgi:hypothetical protein